MKKQFIYILASITTFVAHSQSNLDDEQFEKKIQENLDIQIDLLKAYNNQILKEVEQLKREYGSKKLNSKKISKKKETLKKSTNASIETIFGISENQGLVNLTNFNIEIDDKKNKGLEMGLFIDINDIKTQGLNVSSEVFIFNLGYTNQINFLSTKSRNITTRLIIGGSIGTEVLNDESKLLPNGAILETEGGIIYGGYAGAAIIFKINHHFSAIVRNSIFLTTSDTSLYKFIVGAGLRFNF